VTIVVSGNLMRFTQHHKEIEIEASSVAKALETLTTRYPSLRMVVYDGDGRVRGAHRLYLNGEPIADTDLASVATNSMDEVAIVTAIAGG
jgi:sulfur carrier protein ThiS